MCLIQYDECIKDFDNAVKEVESFVDYKMVTRKGTTLRKMEKSHSPYIPESS